MDEHRRSDSRRFFSIATNSSRTVVFPTIMEGLELRGPGAWRSSLLAAIESVLTAIHLLAVGVAGVGPLVCVWLEWRGGNDPRRAELIRQFARGSLHALWLGMLLGVTCLGLLGLHSGTRFWEAIQVIPARRIGFGVAELAFSVVCLGIYAQASQRLPRWAHRALAILAGTNLLYHFPFLFSAVTVISQDGSLLNAEHSLTWREIVALFWRADTLSRTVHFLLAACVATGVVIMALASTRRRETSTGTPEDYDRGGRELERTSRAARSSGGTAVADSKQTMPSAVAPLPRDPALAMWGARFSLVAAVAQAPAGLWLLSRLPSTMRDPFLAADGLTTLLFAAGVVVLVGLLHHLAAVALGDLRQESVRRVMILTAAIFVLMVGAGHRARGLAMTAANSTAAASVSSATSWPAAVSDSTIR